MRIGNQRGEPLPADKDLMGGLDNLVAGVEKELQKVRRSQPGDGLLSR